MVASRSEPRAGEVWPVEGARGVVEHLGLNASVLKPLQWKQGQITPLYYLETSEGRFVLKLPTPRPGRRFTPLRRYLTRQEIEHQARVLEQLGNNSYAHLRVPRLVASDYRSYILTEFLDTQPHGEHDLPRRELLRSLLEFQTSEIVLPRTPLTRLGRDPGVLLARHLITSLRSRIGWNRTARALRTVSDCYRAQACLPGPVLRHNDFHYNNLMLGKGGELYFSDFEYVSYDRRWLLGDIVYFAVATKDFRIDGGLILEYEALLRDSLGYDFDLGSQLRFNLLLRVGRLVVSRSAPAEVSAQYERLFTDVLIDDERFERWLTGLPG